MRLWFKRKPKKDPHLRAIESFGLQFQLMGAGKIEDAKKLHQEVEESMR